jgi:hypothetical protein
MAPSANPPKWVCESGRVAGGQRVCHPDNRRSSRTLESRFLREAGRDELD